MVARARTRAQSARARFENEDPKIDEAEGKRFKKRDQLFPQFWPVSCGV